MFLNCNFKIRNILLVFIMIIGICFKFICLAHDISQEYLYYFCSEEISFELKEFMTGRSFKENNNIISFDDLRYVRVLYWGIDDEIHEGEMVVNRDVAEDVIDIFKELFNKKYKIYQMKLLDCYGADYRKSLADNNTISFYMSDSCNSLEEKYHSLGLAIDINPLFNDFLFKEESKMNTLEEIICDKIVINDKDDCYNAFTSRKWTWDGDIGNNCKCFFKEK